MVAEYARKPFLIASFLCAILFYSGFVKIPARYPFVSLFSNDSICGLSGIIKSSPVRNGNGKYYSVKVAVNKSFSVEGGFSDSSGIIELFIPTEMVEVYYPGKLYSLAFNKGLCLYEQGCNVKVTGRFSSNIFLVKSCDNSFWSETFAGTLWYIRAMCRLQLRRLLYLWGKAGGLLLALLSGAREYTDLTTAEAFKNAGLSHILALSGMHLSLFSGIAHFFGNRIGRRNLTIIFRILIILLFVWFAGMSPSLCRAFICNFLLLFSLIADVRKPDMLIILSVSFLLQTVIFPNDIKNSGFILSYTALAGILITNKFFSKFYFKFLPARISNSFAASSGAQLFTAPISLCIFGSCNPIGIIASVIVSPLVTIFIYTGIALIILSIIIPPIASASGIFMNILYTIIDFLVGIFSKFPAVKI
ncbi:MAG: ComEC/Rec2 family competence protein [Treponema sp.]|nr:ComEC/Rec2 family competence protein [Treponema sp.]